MEAPELERGVENLEGSNAGGKNKRSEKRASQKEAVKTRKRA